MSVLDIERDDAGYGVQTLVSAVTLDDADVGEDQAVLFAAVCGHARLVEKLGGDEARRSAERGLKRMERAVEMYGGRVVKQLDGELLAFFTNGDAAAQAAVEIQLRVADIPPVSNVKLGVRAAFSFGPIFAADDGFGGAAISRTAALAGAAGPGQVFTDESGAAALSPAWRKTLEARGAGLDGEVVFQLKSALPANADTGERSAEAAVSVTDVSNKRLCLRYRGEVIIFPVDTARVMFGRDSQCDLVVHDRRASRQHAYIERRGSKLVLVDTSTNGTVLDLQGRPAVFLRHAEGLVYGKGRFSVPGVSRTASPDAIEFELI